MARDTKTVGVTPKGVGIQIRFTLHGQTLRPELPMKATIANLQYASRLRQQILREIAQGTFNMIEHFPDYRFADKVRPAATQDARTFGDWVEVWEKLAERDLEYSTLTIYKRHMAAYWTPEFGSKMPAHITHELVLSRLATLSAERFDEVTGKTRRGLSRKTQNNILIPLRSVFDLICRGPGAPPHPIEGVKNLKVQVPDPDPFSLEEVEIALTDIRQRHGEAWADYYEFAAFAGLRVSEQIALLWDDVDMRSQTIIVRRVKVMAQKKNRTKTTVQRSVELNARAAAVLKRQRMRRANAEGADEVFINPVTERPWHDDQEQRKAWTSSLRRCKIRHRPPKELRDTSVTLALSAGADPWYVSKQHGHSLQVMMRSYAKWIPSADKGRNRAAINQALGMIEHKKEMGI